MFVFFFADSAQATSRMKRRLVSSRVTSGSPDSAILQTLPNNRCKQTFTVQPQSSPKIPSMLFSLRISAIFPYCKTATRQWTSQALEIEIPKRLPASFRSKKVIAEGIRHFGIVSPARKVSARFPFSSGAVLSVCIRTNTPRRQWIT